MAAGEDQPEPVVGKGRRRVLRLSSTGGILGGGTGLDEQGQFARQGGLPAYRIEGAAACRRGEPRPGTGRDAAPCPGGQRLRVRLLNALLGQVDVARDAHRRGEHEGPLATVRIGDSGTDLLAGPAAGGHPRPQEKVMIGRTSTPPYGAGTCLAIEIASSRSAASIR